MRWYTSLLQKIVGSAIISLGYLNQPEGKNYRPIGYHNLEIDEAGNPLRREDLTYHGDVATLRIKDFRTGEVQAYERVGDGPIHRIV